MYSFFHEFDSGFLRFSDVKSSDVDLFIIRRSSSRSISKHVVLQVESYATRIRFRTCASYKFSEGCNGRYLSAHNGITGEIIARAYRVVGGRLEHNLLRFDHLRLCKHSVRFD